MNLNFKDLILKFSLGNIGRVEQACSSGVFANADRSVSGNGGVVESDFEFTSQIVAYTDDTTDIDSTVQI